MAKIESETFTGCTDNPPFTPLDRETRPTVSTAAAAFYLHLEPETLQKNANLGRGPLKPVRLPGSSKLHWVTNEIRSLLGGVEMSTYTSVLTASQSAEFFVAFGSRATIDLGTLALKDLVFLFGLLVTMPYNDIGNVEKLRTRTLLMLPVVDAMLKHPHSMTEHGSACVAFAVQSMQLMAVNRDGGTK